LVRSRFREGSRTTADRIVLPIEEAGAVSGRCKLWEIQCDVELPCATQNELTGKDADALLRGGCTAVAEGANIEAFMRVADAMQSLGLI